MLNINTCSAEFQAEAKRLGLTGFELIKKYKTEGIIKSDYKIKKEEIEAFAKNKGFISYKEYQKNKYYKNREHYINKEKEYHYARGGSPMVLNPDCNLNFGIEVGETFFNTFLREIFENVEWRVNLNRPSLGKCVNFLVSNPSFKFKNDHNNLREYFKSENIKSPYLYKIAVMSKCMDSSDMWGFAIDYNKDPDFWILSAWDNRDSLNLEKVWIFHRDMKIRKGTNHNIKTDFWRRQKFVISNKNINEFSMYELKEWKEKGERK